MRFLPCFNKVDLIYAWLYVSAVTRGWKICATSAWMTLGETDPWKPINTESAAFQSNCLRFMHFIIINVYLSLVLGKNMRSTKHNAVNYFHFFVHRRTEMVTLSSGREQLQFLKPLYRQGAIYIYIYIYIYNSEEPKYFKEGMFSRGEMLPFGSSNQWSFKWTWSPQPLRLVTGESMPVWATNRAWIVG